MAATTYHCEVQPPTPILCNSTFSDYANQQPADNSSLGASSNSSNQMQDSQNNYLTAKQFGLNRDASSNGSSWDMTNEDTMSNQSVSAQSHHTHDPYQMNRRTSSMSSSSSSMPQNNYNSQTHTYSNQSYNNNGNGYAQEQQYYQENQQYNGNYEQQDYAYEQPQEQYPVYENTAPMNVPPSLQLASQSRRRQNEDLFPEQQEQYPYPAQQQQGFVAHSHQQQDQPQHQGRQQQQSSNAAAKPFPECCYHKALVNRMEFIQPPAVREAGTFPPSTRSTNYLRVFIGQCRFESTPAELRWLVHYLTNVQPVKVELRGTGCFMAYVQNYEEVYALLNLKEKLLFDHTGVWYARDEEQASFLRRYVQSYVAGIGKGFRLPKDMVVLHDQQVVQQQQQQRKFQARGPGHHNNGHHNGSNSAYAPQQRSSVNNFYAPRH